MRFTAVSFFCAVLGACWGVSASAAVIAPAGVDWDTYGFAISRPSLNPYETTIKPANVHLLRQAWSFKLGSVLDTQPLLARQVPVRVANRLVVPIDLVIVGSENGSLAAVNAATGKKVWERRLGAVHVPGCGDLPDFGITGTPAIDRSTNSVYVADGKSRLYQLGLSTGRTMHRWTLTRDPLHEHVWSALSVLRGTVYAEIAGNCNILPYHGQVVSVNTRSGAIRRWFVTSGGTQGGGIWSWAGVSIDPQRRVLYEASGPSFAANDHIGYAEHVVRLTLGLHEQASNYPPGLPSPGDADFGSTPLLYQAPGCPRQLAIGNKRGNFYVYDRDRIGSGPVQTIALGGSSDGQDAVLGIAAYSPDLRLVYVANPRRRRGYLPGMLAFRVTSHCRLSLRWQVRGPGTLASSPTIADGVLFFGTGKYGHVVALDSRTGKRLWASDHQIHGPIFNAPSVVNGAMYVSSWDGRLHAFGLK